MNTIKKIILVLPAIGITSLVGCEKVDIEKGTPDCVRQHIREFNKRACEKGASAKEYIFQSKTVYVLDPGTCGADLSAKVIDMDCNDMGYLGGIDGNTKINGEAFSNATFIRTLWED